MPKKIKIDSLFSSLQTQMSTTLKTNREFITHSGSKGDSLENAWIEWLRAYLPNRYNVDKAIVIDHEGNTSDQMDIVIYDHWFTPFIFSQNGFHYIPAEGVYAVFEVKPDLKGSVEGISHIEYAGNKIQSVRNLKRTSASMINSGSIVNARPLTKILGGILTSTNTIGKLSTIESQLRSQTGLKSIDFGCAVDYGSFFVEYSGEEDTTLREAKDFQKRYSTYYNSRVLEEVKFSKPENSLITFFMQLTQYLQQAIGTVPAIDLQAYISQINETIDKEI